MKIAYNPLGSGAYIPAPDNKDLIFDLATKITYVRGVPFYGTKYEIFKKHTSSDNTGGSEGLVPAPSYSTTNTRLLREDGLWINVPGVLAPDTSLDTESTNTVENRVITRKINEILASLLLKAENVYKNIIVGDFLLQAKGINDTLEFILGEGILLIPNEDNKSITISTRALGLLGINITYSSGQLIAKVEDTYYNHWNETYNWYRSVTDEDTDEYINKWNEITDFLDSVKEGTDILDEFVTRKTDLLIVGQKTFVLTVLFGNNGLYEDAKTKFFRNASAEKDYGTYIINAWNSGDTRLILNRNGVYFRGVSGVDNEIYHKGNLKSLSDLSIDLYWANVSVTSTPNTTTTPTFGGASIVGGTDSGINFRTGGDYSRMRFYNSDGENNATIHYFNTAYNGYTFVKDTINIHSKNAITVGLWNNPTMFIIPNSPTNNNIVGRVGINTTNPICALDVNGSGKIYGTLLVGASVVDRPTISTLNKAQLTIGNFVDSNRGTFSYGTAFWTEGSGKGFIQQGRGDGTLAAYPLILQALGGNVGIGVHSPGHKLEVQGRIMTSSDLVDGIIIHRTTAGTGAFIRYLANNLSAKGWRTGSLGVSNDFTFEYSTDAFSTTTQRMLIKNTGDTYIYGNLNIGASGTRNYLAFSGTTGDNPGTFTHTYIGENIWGSSESSELVLYKGNDVGTTATTVSGSGADRIRHIAGGHLFQVYKSSLSGSFEAICTSTVPVNMLAIHQSSIQTYAPLVIVGERHEGNYGINMSNSNIVGLNAIFTLDVAEGANEGYLFKRTNGNYDSIWCADGTFYFSPNGNNASQNGLYSTNYTVLHTGNYVATLDGRYVNVTGDTMTGTLTFNIASDTGLIKNTYSGTTYNIIRTHNNGNISISASSGALYLGYENTGLIYCRGTNINIDSGNYTSYVYSQSQSDSRYVNVTGDTMTGLLTVATGGSHLGIKVGNTYINAIGSDLILQNNGALRFGGDSWDYNIWAGLKYNHSSKTISLGLADGNTFTTNSRLSGGIVLFPGIARITAPLFYYDIRSASTVPVIYIGANNVDATLLRVYSSDTADPSNYAGRFGFSLKYLGTGSGNANVLAFYADGQASTTLNLAIGIDLYGYVGIGTTSPTDKLDVVGNIRAIRGTKYIQIRQESDTWSSFYTNANKYYFDKPIEVNGNHSPYVNNSFSSGTDAKRWSNIYTYRGHIRTALSTALPTYSNAPLQFDFSYNANDASNSRYRPWFGGLDSVTSYGYGVTVSTGIYRDPGYSSGGYYIGIGWDGNASSVMFKFSRNGYLYGNFSGNFSGNASSATKVLIHQHTTDNAEYPIVWSNSNNTTNAVNTDLLKSYNHLLYNPSAHRITTGQYVANNSGGPHFTANSASGSWAYLRLNNSAVVWDIATKSNSGSGGLWLSRYNSLDVGIFVSAATTPRVGINTNTPSYPLHVIGDTYTTTWSRSGNGFYVEGTGVHFTHQGTLGEINIANNNEFLWSTSNGALHFNYRAASRGTTVTSYVWNAGSSSTYATHTLGALTSRGNQTLYGMTSTCNSGNTTAGPYTTAAVQIREYNFGGALSDTWGNAPRLAWHWSGRVAAQIGLASNGYLYTAPLTATNWYKLVYESGTWAINISGNANYSTSAGNSDTVDGYHASSFIFHQKYSSLSALPSGSNGWYKIASISDTSGSPCIFMVRAYAHSSAIFTVSKGWSTTGNITQLQYCSSNNGSYCYILGARLLSDGTVEILLNKPSANNSSYVNINISMYNPNNVKLNTSLTLDSGSPTVIQSMNFSNNAMVAGTFVGNLSGNASTVTVTNSDSNSTYRMVWHSGNSLYSTAGIYCNPSSDYLYAASMNASDWFRSTGSTGWYNATNSCHISPNDVSTYGGLKFRGEKGGYTGFLLGNSTNYMNLMDNGTDKGLYQQGKSWILYYNRSTNQIGLLTSSLADAVNVAGVIRSTASSRYLRLGPQNTTYAHYETNADVSHWFNKRIDVNGAIWRYNTNYGIDSDGKFYAHTVYANRSGSSTAGGVSLYSNIDPMTYGIAFRGTSTYGTHGYVTSDWATYLTMNDLNSRGWIFRRGSTNVASIDSSGLVYANGRINGSYYTSRVATGTQPYACTSTTLNTNLNADMLDSLHASAFMRHRGWWSSGDTHSADGIATGMYFAYNNHGVPNHWGTLVTFAYLESASYNLQLHGTGDNYLYYRNRSADYGQKPWKRLADANELKDPASYYWANVKVSSASSTSTSPTFQECYANGWFRSTGNNGWYNPTHNSHIHPNGTTTYGNLVVRGTKSDYTGINLGNSTSNMTVMSNTTHHGLYCESTGWEFYYNRVNKQVGILTSTTTSGHSLTVGGNISVVYNSCPGLTIHNNTTSGEASIYIKNNTAGWALGVNTWSVGAGVFAIGLYSGTGSSSWRFKIDNNGYCFTKSYLNLGGGHEKNASSPTYVWGSNSTDTYLRSYLTSKLSVNYAASAGSVAWANVTGKPSTYTPASHTHTSLAIDSAATFGSSCMLFKQLSGSFDGNSGWSHYLVFNHGDGNTYYHYNVAFPFWGPPKYKRQSGSTDSVTAWYTLISTENIANLSVSYATTAGSANSVAWANVTGKPTIPSVGNGTITITQGGTTKGTFTVNLSGNTTIALTDTDTNTHWTTRIYAGASGTAANAAATNPYLKVTDDNTYRNQVRFVGGGATTVSSDANGNITISSTNTNTTYSAGTGLALSGTTFSLKTTSAGSTTKGIYLSSGTFSPMTYSLSANVNAGTASKLAYYSGANAIDDYTSTVGSSVKPMYLNAGVPTACSGTVVKYWATYIVVFSLENTITKKSGNHDFFKNYNSTSTLTIGKGIGHDANFPSGYDINNTIISVHSVVMAPTASEINFTVPRVFVKDNKLYVQSNTTGTFKLSFVCIG